MKNLKILFPRIFFGFLLLGTVLSPIEQLAAQSPREYYNEASRLRSQGSCQEAIVRYTEAIRANPEYVKAYAERAYCKSQLKLYAQALMDYDVAVRLGSQDPITFLNRGWAKYNLGKKKEACEDWEIAEQLGYSKIRETIKKYCRP